MCPELFHIGPFPVRSYGLLLALSFLFGVLYIWWTARRDNRPFEPLLNIAYLLIFSGIIGSRLFYVLVHLDEFKDNWTATFNPFADGQFGISGLSVYGGIVLCTIAMIVYCRFKRLPMFETMDIFAPTVGIGLFFGRLGCFFNGCCFGTPTDVAWGVVFPQGSMPWATYGDVALHPAQIYSALYGAILFLILHWLSRRKTFHGQIIAVFFMLEAVFRTVLESVRWYETEMYVTVAGVEITLNIVTSIALFALGVAIVLIGRRNRISMPV
jgi:phosphatidylglycerol---prolipoprotein diacylglyceryl transferase